MENEREYMPVAFYLYDKGMMTTDIDDLITAFEMLVNADEKKNKGIVYTPAPINRSFSDFCCQSIEKKIFYFLYANI